MFVHVVLFRCPDSGDPIGATLLSDARNLEEVDSHSFKLTCACGWIGTLFGISRVRSWIQEWGQ